MRCSNRIVRYAALFSVNLMAGPALAANGCAPGTFATTHSPDGNATSFLFDNFHATSDTNQGSRRARCTVSAPVTAPKGFSVFAVDYRGFVVKNASQSVRLTGGGSRLYDPTGSVTRDFLIHRRMGSSDLRNLDISMRLAADGLPGDVDPAEIYLDTLDVARIGFVTMDAVTASLDGVAAQRREIVSGLRASADQLLGFADPFAGDDFISAFTGTDGTTGFNARWNASDALTVRAGLLRTDPGGTIADADSTYLFAASSRYAVPLNQGWTAFGELGGWAAPDVEARYIRAYIDGTRPISVTHSANATALGIFARMGVVYAPNTDSEIALSTRFSRAMLDVSAYDERGGADNLFAAHMSGRMSSLDTADVALAWTQALTSTIDYTLSAAVGREFGNNRAVAADIDWVGKARGGWDARYFGSTALRVGWAFREGWSVDTTAAVDFTGNADPAWNLGLRLKASF